MNSGDKCVRIERDLAAKTATVILSRPQRRNAVDRATAVALANAFRELDADTAINAIVLWGEGGTFCGGADLKAFSEGQTNRVASDGDGPMGPTRMLMHKPVIAAIAGYAVAGGLELALWCDLRVAETGSTLGVFCRRVGVPLIDGGTIRLPRLIGLSRALDMILTGRPVAADEAHSIGLVNRVVADGTARAAAEGLAADLARLPQTALLGDRRSAYAQASLSLDDAISFELECGMGALAEGAQGAKHFAGGAGRHGEPIDAPD